MADRAACFDVPKYHARLWSDFAKDASEAPRVAEEGDRKVAGFGEGFLPELYHRMYADAPREVASPEAPARARAKLHELATELPELEPLRTRTLRDPLWSGLATVALGDAVARALPVHKSPPVDADAAARILRGMQAVSKVSPEVATAMADRLAEGEGAAAGACFAVGEQATTLDDSAIRTALRAGIEAAHDAIDQAEGTLDALGWGEGDGGTSGALQDPRTAIALARKVASSATLQRIVELAGRLRAAARAKRATRSDFARSEIVGVEPTDDYANLVPGELAALTHPLTAADLCSRVGERAAIGWQLKGTERLQRGPLVILIDQSGSMLGDRDAWAKAVALALLDAARRDRRAFGIILYAGCVTDAKIYSDPWKADPAEILAMLSRQANGNSTDFAPPMAHGLGWIENSGSLKRADIVHVTDGAADTSEARTAMKRADACGAHVFGIAIGTEGRALHSWSHEVASIRDVSDDAKAVDLIFDGILP